MGNFHDVKFFDDLYDNSFIDTNLINKKYKKKSYFLGNKAYDCKKIRNKTETHKNYNRL